MTLAAERPALLMTLLLLAGASHPARSADRIDLAGDAFGTTYRVTVARPPPTLSRARLERVVESVLDRVDRQMSSYRPDSELSRFNHSSSTGWIVVAPDLVHVTRVALDVAERSTGAFDPTVGALVRAWGWGGAPQRDAAPTPTEVAALRAASGRAQLAVQSAPPALRKHAAGLQLDLSGIAKGFAIDEIVSRLTAHGVDNALVEIGGELRGLGRRTRETPWSIGVEDPTGGHDLLRIALADRAIATSGTTRRFRRVGAERRPHILDPRTGEPISHDGIAVSVIAPTAMEADAWATALLVAGPRDGWALAQREGLAALFVQTPDGGSTTQRRATERFWSQVHPRPAERRDP